MRGWRIQGYRTGGGLEDFASSGPSPAQDRRTAVFRGLRGRGAPGRHHPRSALSCDLRAWQVFLDPCRRGRLHRLPSSSARLERTGSGPEATLQRLPVSTACRHAGIQAYGHATLPDRAFIAGFDLQGAVDAESAAIRATLANRARPGAADHPDNHGQALQVQASAPCAR